MKRPERSRYVIPALRIKSSKECEDGTEGQVEDKWLYANEFANMQTNMFRKHESSQRRYTNIVPRQIRFESSSSSSNTKYTSNESCEDVDSSDFEDGCCDIEADDSLRIRNETSEDDSIYLWKKGAKERSTENNHGIKIRPSEVKTEILSNKLLQQKDNLDLEYLSYQDLSPKSNEEKLNENLFYNYADSSLSDIEAVIDSYTKKGSLLTSTPNSDIVDERILDAAKYGPKEETEMESTVLAESDMQITMSTNKNSCGYNFEIFHDPSSVKKQPKDYAQIFGHDYIPPPVPPPAHTFRLPPIHRLPSPIPSVYKLPVQHPAFIQSYVPRTASLQACRHSAASFQSSVIRSASPELHVPRVVSPGPYVPRSASPGPYVPRSASPGPYVPRSASPGPYVPRAASPQPYESRVASPQPYVSSVASPQPYVPRAASPQPNVPRAASPEPYVPRAASPHPPAPDPVSSQTSVPRPICLEPSVFRPVPILPPIPRPVFPQLSLSHSAFRQHMPQLFTQIQHPRLLVPQCLQVFPDSSHSQPCRSSIIQQIPRHFSSPYMQPVFDPLSSKPPYTSFHKARAISQHSLQDRINSPNSELHKLDGQSYIPPPVPPPWIRCKLSDLQF